MEPDEIEKKEFLVSLRGYDRDEVDAYLRELAETVRELRRLSAEPGAPAPAAPPSSTPDLSDALRQVGEETSQILITAQKVAQEMKDKALRESAEVIADARAQAAAIAEAAQEARRQTEQDVKELHDARAMLATQLEDVRRRLDETIARLQATAPTEIASSPKPKLATQPIAQAVAAERKRSTVEPKPEVREAATQEPAEMVRETEAPAPAPAADNAIPASPIAEAEDVPAETSPPSDLDVAPDPNQDVATLLDEIRQEREAGRRQVEELLTTPAEAEPSSPPVGSPAAPAVGTKDPLAARDQALGDATLTASRRMKRLLQEDQNDLLDRIRTKRGKGNVDDNVPSQDEQFARFKDGMQEVLTKAFGEGRTVGGAPDPGDATRTIENLITKQVVNPLRTEITRAVEAGISAEDTPTSIAERTSDIFRVWKGVRTELLGEGMVYAAFHHGLMDAWRSKGAAQKSWVISSDEAECPRDVCKTNAAAGSIAVQAPFPSGHLAPPAHGGCSCTIEGPTD